MRALTTKDYAKIHSETIDTSVNLFVSNPGKGQCENLTAGRQRTDFWIISIFRNIFLNTIVKEVIAVNVDTKYTIIIA